MRAHYFKQLALPCLLLLLTGCQTVKDTNENLFGPEISKSTLTPRASTYRDLISLPQPRGKIVATVYTIRDQTGQYKPMPASSFSTAVTQGATAMLVNAMNDSGWFIPLEREGLQNLLTERKIIRAALKKPNTPQNNDEELPSLLAANVLIEGSVVAYESNIKTGGAGARYFGIGASEQYRSDQVTVNLRAIDIRSGRILHSVMTSKSILSQELSGGVFRFVEFKRLLEVEAGMTTNEPAQMCVLSALEAALIHLIADGLKKNSWSLANPEELNNPVLQQYLSQTPDIL
ncbi:CsgG/HfaB family protein [Simiduia aestuariiviva]|uniref:Curli production assembly/transport component CsgG n=1 Tax=Simiduia aestuariiviva TaxID=1510459 RepID=A0A839UTL0_9GAMM|nr:CsgG/HfaB family protein [Simiduia aestuariiviva]MBB3170061.1 curli production assembly/transport component CsgG [Simiduia aestuariiviva]